ncbi:TonB-dependent receptor plug domain-containing protein [Puniceicoccaceae bacterium K14]|nr:TonB-dependent receptor plug domain-containing protein [Puniceicoccaceae bacterium K14]
MIDNLCAVDQLRVRLGKPLAFAFAISVLSIPFSGAQSDDDGEIFELSPFTVDASSDVGYRSTNTTSGTSLNTPIKDIPMSIEVINQDFLKDRGANSFAEALEYSSGVFTEEFSADAASGTRNGVNAPGANDQDSADRSPSSRGGLGGRFDNVVIIRGFNVPFQNRDGFRYGGLIAQENGATILGGILDSSNIDRMEVVRGPNSLLYGIGVLSGIVNVVAKRPLPEQVASVDVAYGSYDYFRSTIDVTGPLVKDFLGGQLNYRLAVTHQEEGDWTDYRTEELDYYVAQLQYQSNKLTVFLEGQYADQQVNGIGSQFLYDNLNAAVDQGFRNEWGEQHNFTQDFDENGVFNENRDSVSDSFRVTGPDTYDRREEKNLMLNADYTPFENFTISAGVFFTEAEEEELDVNLSTLTNQERSFLFKTAVNGRDQNTEYAFPDELQAFRDDYVTVFENDHIDTTGISLDPVDYRMARYWWTRTPEETTSEQYRIRMTYTMETEDFFSDSKAKHTFLVGRHDIKDDARIVTGNELIGNQYTGANTLLRDDEGNVIPQLAELDIGDPLMFRNIYDKTPIRFMVDEDGDGVLEASPTAVSGSEYSQVDIWFTGHYALYQGSFMDNKLGIIIGARHDRYHSRVRVFDRYDDDDPAAFDQDPDNNNLLPTSAFWWNNQDNSTFGFSTEEGDDLYLPSPTAAETEVTTTIAVNYKITDDLTVYAVRAEGLTPNTGALDGNFDGIPSEQSTSYEIGLKFDLWESRLSGTLSFYRIERENALWNFTNAPDPSSWPLVDGVPPLDPTSTADVTNSFSPEYLEEVGGIDLGNGGQIPLNYGIDDYYFQQDGITVGAVRINPDDPRNTSGRPNFVNPDGYLGAQAGGGTSNIRTTRYLEYNLLDEPVIDSSGFEHLAGGDRVLRVYETADDFVRFNVDADGNMLGEYTGPADDLLTWRHYMELAFADVSRSSALFDLANGPEDFDPIDYDRERNSPNGFHSSIPNITGANVIYSDESNGIDLNLVYSITDNWQAIFSYSHIEREATSPFQLVDASYTNDEGTFSFGTEYDQWVRTFGREAFGLVEHKDENGNVYKVSKADGDGSQVGLGEVSPLDLVGGLQGTSLYFGAEDSASIWSKYSITEGKFKNLEFGFGAVYTGPQATSVPIGGSTLAQNLFGTPDTKERVKVDASLNYKWRWQDLDFAARLNVYNLTDDTEGEVFVRYEDEDGDQILRRTVNMYAPLSARLSLSVLF